MTIASTVSILVKMKLGDMTVTGVTLGFKGVLSGEMTTELLVAE